MSDQVIRYETEQEYLDYINHRRYLATGTLIKFPDPFKEYDAYWAAFDDYRAKHPDAVLENWTILHKQQIDILTGALIGEDCTYDTLVYENLAEGQASRKRAREEERPDPGVPVSVEFKDLSEAERMRALLMQGEPGYYYDIKHRTQIAVIDREKTNAE